MKGKWNWGKSVSIENRPEWVGDLAQWESACLASAKPWVRSPAPIKRKKKKKSTGLHQRTQEVEECDGRGERAMMEKVS